MEIIKDAGSVNHIPILYFSVCHEDGKTRQEISKLYTKEEVTTHKSCYYLEKFVHHLKLLGISLEEYIRKNLKSDWPKCPINNQEVNIGKINGKGVIFNTYVASVTKENSPKFKEFCERISIERKGEGNPMFQKTPWNKGETSETNDMVKRVAELRLGRIASEETKQKQREARAESPIKARHTTKHTPETIEKLRQHTANLWATGVFNRVTSIHIAMREFLKTLDLKYDWEEEFLAKYYSLDFAFPEIKVGIECQGTYYHIDPRKYPDGPINALQRRNAGRDKSKRTYLENRGWTVIEIWETEINNGEFKEYLICKLKELKILEV